MEFRGSISHDSKCLQNRVSIEKAEEIESHGIILKDSMIVNDTSSNRYNVRLLVHNKSRHSVPVRAQDAVAFLQVERESTISEIKTDDTFTGLVGPACESEVYIDGILCNSLLDSGSQVTTISRSFYLDNLAHNTPLESMSNHQINVEGAGGQTISYDGFVRIKVKLPQELVGLSEEVNTFALVCPDTMYSRRVPLIIGTNTFRSLSGRCRMKGGPHFLSTLPIRSEVRYAYRDSLIDPSGVIGKVKLLEKNMLNIPPGKIVELKGICKSPIPSTRDAVLIQGSTRQRLPPGLEIVNGLTSVLGHLPRVKILLRNTSRCCISIHPKKVVAELHAVEHETSIDVAQKNVTSYMHGVESMADTIPDQGAPNSDEEIEFDFSDSPISEEWKTRIKKRLKAFHDVFSKHEYDVGRTDAIKHEIKLRPGPIIRERPRPIPARDYEDARRHIQSLLDAKIIKPSNSPYASPIVLVRKKNGKLRLTIDYRKINLRTVRDSYPIPKIADIFSALHGSKFFTTMDLKMGFHQIPMEESSKDITAFVCPFGLYSFETMSQGLCNSPLTFQRLMERCVGDMNYKELLVYLDDLIVHGKTLEEAEERLVKTLRRLRAFGLKLDPKKCKFFQTSVKHLGHIVSADGILPDPDKTLALETWPVPTSLRDLKKFLGFTGYFRTFIDGYSHIIKPLNKLTAGYLPPKTMRKMKEKGKDCSSALTMRSNIQKQWTAECQEAFETVIKKLTTPPVLGFADLTSPFILHTDASNVGLGACLYQSQEGKLRVIAYASRGLSKSETNYPAHKKEFLALKWAVTDKFHDYLYGGKFTVITDNNPLTYILSSAKLDATGYRWLAALSTYDFDIRYRRGLNHQDADGLSRRPCGPPDDDEEYNSVMHDIEWLASRIHSLKDGPESVHITSTAIQIISKSHQVVGERNKHQASPISSPGYQNIPYIETLTTTGDGVPFSLEHPVAGANQMSVPNITTAEWQRLQSADPDINYIMKCVKEKRKPDNHEFRYLSRGAKLYVRNLDKLKLVDGVLHRFITDERGFDRQQLVLPPSHREQAMDALHNDMGHLGHQNTLRIARQRFFWPFMATAIENKCKQCERCIRRKAVCEKAEMQSIVSNGPFQLVCMDFLSIEPDSKGIKDVLVITDHFTKFAIAVATKNQKAQTVAEALWENVISVYGWPEQLHSDQGRDFQSKVISELCKIGNVKKSRTSPYHPQANPVERYNRTLLSMLGSLHESQKRDWRKYVKPLTHAYNCMVNETTGYSPYFLLFGRHARLPIDILFGTDPDVRRSKDPTQYVRDLKERLQHAYKLAQESAKKSAAKNKAYYDKRAKASTFEKGDRVLVRKVAIKGKQKLADRWEPGVYVIQEKLKDIPVYVVQEEGRAGKSRTLHRNLLLSCGSLPTAEVVKEKPSRIQLRSRKQKDNTLNLVNDEEADFEDDEEADVPQIDVGRTPVIEIQCPDFDSRLNAASPEFQPRITQDTVSEALQDAVTSEYSLDLDDMPGDLADLQNDDETSTRVSDDIPDDLVDHHNSSNKGCVNHDSNIQPIEALDDMPGDLADLQDSDETLIKVSGSVPNDLIDHLTFDEPESQNGHVVLEVSNPTPDMQDGSQEGLVDLQEVPNTPPEDNNVTRLAGGTQTPPQVETVIHHENEVRRSTRVRQPPKRMTFDRIGEPTTLNAMQIPNWFDWAKSFLPLPSNSGTVIIV